MRALKGLGAALAGSILSIGTLFSSGCSSQVNQDIERRVAILERENIELRQKVTSFEGGAPENYSIGKKASETEKSQNLPPKNPLSASNLDSKSELQEKSPYNFNFGGTFETGVRNIKADRQTGNEMSMNYKLDVSGDLSRENIGLHARFVIIPPVSETARNYKVFEELGDEFQLRELYFYYDFGNHKFSGGKLKLPLGLENLFEDERWNEPLLEYYLERYGTYDIGVRIDSKWNDNLASHFALTSGNAGKMDTNSAICFSGNLEYKFDSLPVKIGIWGKNNYIDSTPIKRVDQTGGLFFDVEKDRWRLLGKAGLVRQGLNQPDFSGEELGENGYNAGEGDDILLQRNAGDVKRTIKVWYLYGSIPLGEKVDLFAHYGQAFDIKDIHETDRQRGGAGLRWEIIKNLSLSGGMTIDNSTSNTRPYLVEKANMDKRNGFTTYWAKVCWKF